MDSESMGYAYVYPLDGSPRQEYLISMSPENMANFIGKQGYDAEKIIITDVLDRLVVNTSMVFLDTCLDHELCRKTIGYLAPIQMGEKEAGNILAVGRDIARNGLKGKLLPELFRHWQQMWKILMNMKSYSLAIPFGGIQRRLLSIRF